MELREAIFRFWLFLQEMIQAPLTLLWIAFQFPIVRKYRIDKKSVFRTSLYWVCCIKEKVFLRNQSSHDSIKPR